MDSENVPSSQPRRVVIIDNPLVSEHAHLADRPGCDIRKPTFLRRLPESGYNRRHNKRR